jgi:acetyltransferase-like isoleucine patch superfamily enzyme
VVFAQGVRNIYQSFSAFCRLLYLGFRYNDLTVAEYYRKQGAKIGKNCRIHSRSVWGDAKQVTIGNHVFIAQGVILHTHDGGAWILREEVPRILVTGTINIEDNCVIGANAQLLPDVHIGANSIIGAGSVVINDIPANSIALGVPARVIGSTLKYKEKNLAKWNQQIARQKLKQSDLKPDQTNKS